MRCQLAKRLLKAHRRSATEIQTFWRKTKHVLDYQKSRASLILIQSVIRMVLVRSNLRRQRDAIEKIASWLRGVSDRRKYRRELASRRIQSCWRRFLSQEAYLRAIRAIVVIQSSARCFLVRITCPKKLMEAMPAQHDEEAGDELESITHSFIEKSASSNLITKHQVTSMSIGRASELPGGKQTSSEKRLEMHAKSNEPLMEEALPFAAPQPPSKNEPPSFHTQLAAEKLRDAIMDEMHQSFSKRVDDLCKANDGLIKEVFKLRNETASLRKKHYTSTLQMSSKLSLAEDEIKNTRRKCEKKVQGLERKLKERESQIVEAKQSLNTEVSLLKQGHTASVNKLRRELRKTQESHQEYLTKLMGVLEATHAMREEENTKIAKELRSIKREKDHQILMLQQEVKALRAAKGVQKQVEPSVFIDARSLKEEILSNGDEIADSSRQFNDAIETLTNLVAASNTLPAAVGRHNMEEVIAQQDRAQEMIEMIEILLHLYSNGEERQTTKNISSLDLVENYIAISEPDDAIRELRERLAEAELEGERLREELRQNEYCKRCEVREKAARRRMQNLHE